MKSINEINHDLPEGRLLLLAIANLSQLLDKTPDETFALLTENAKEGSPEETRQFMDALNTGNDVSP